jgi:hypothetical protein
MSCLTKTERAILAAGCLELAMLLPAHGEPLPPSRLSPAPQATVTVPGAPSQTDEPAAVSQAPARRDVHPPALPRTASSGPARALLGAAALAGAAALRAARRRLEA